MEERGSSSMMGWSYLTLPGPTRLSGALHSAGCSVTPPCPPLPPVPWTPPCLVSDPFPSPDPTPFAHLAGETHCASLSQEMARLNPAPPLHQL